MNNSLRPLVLAALLAALPVALASSVYAQAPANDTALTADVLRPVALGEGLTPPSAPDQQAVNPFLLEVQTVPPLRGVRFSVTPTGAATSSPETAVSGRSFVSGDDGIGRIGIDQGTYRLEVLPWEGSEATIRAAFSRWSDDVFFSSREVEVKSDVQLQVGFDVSHLVSLRFVDLAGHPLDWGEGTSVTVTSSMGGRERFVDSEPKWLQAGRVVRRFAGLEETKLLYSVDSVTVGGSNVVNSKQQRFYPSESQEWEIRLSLYSARFTARDALFRFPIGSGIRLQYPDGHSEQLPFESRGELTVTSLPRGSYRVKVDALGLSFSRPVTLSRDQDMQLEVISYLDIGVVFFLVVSLALGLFLIGRPHLVPAFRPRLGLRWFSKRSVGPEGHG